MNHIEDLNLEKEVLPLFDFTTNHFSKNKILEILNHTLKSEDDIYHRQNIFKAFLKNDILQEYSYTAMNFYEVKEFLTNSKDLAYFSNILHYKIVSSKQNRIRNKSKIIQVILFFHRLEVKYFKRIILRDFPDLYANRLKKILEFLSFFQLEYYEYLIRENKLKDSDVIKIYDKLIRVREKGLITNFWGELFLFEAYLSISLGIDRYQFIFPKITNDNLDLRDIYHPLVANPIKNNFQSANNVFVLNGPNMSGKSVFLKSISLCFYLAHIGFGVPASKAIIPFCNFFSISISKKDEILSGYSHFMNEIKHLKAVIKQARNGKSCFVVFDELFSGTNVEDAYEISNTSIRGMEKFDNSYFFISSHIQQLQKCLGDKVSNFYLDCIIVDGNPKFNYLLKEGWSDIKIGKVLFELEGLNQLLDE